MVGAGGYPAFTDHCFNEEVDLNEMLDARIHEAWEPASNGHGMQENRSYNPDNAPLPPALGMGMGFDDDVVLRSAPAHAMAMREVPDFDAPVQRSAPAMWMPWGDGRVQLLACKATV
jgi:hypothetical protein